MKTISRGDSLSGPIQITHQLPFPDRTVDLSSVGITADPDVERAEPGLRRILHFAGEQDCPSAGAESRFQANQLLELLKTSGTEKFEEGTGLAARESPIRRSHPVALAS